MVQMMDIISLFLTRLTTSRIRIIHTIVVVVVIMVISSGIMMK
jgi:hypothetical protein